MTHRNKLLLALGVILTLAFTGSSAINYLITRSSVHREIMQNDLPLTMNNIFSDLTSELNRPIVVASSMAADTFLKDWVMDGERDVVKVKKYLIEIKEKYGFFSTFFVSSRTSNYYHFQGIHKKINTANEHDLWYYDFIDSQKEYELDVDSDEASGNILTIFINFRVEDIHGQLLGVTGVGLKVDSIANLVKYYKILYDRDVYLTDKTGVVQVHQNPEMIEKLRVAEMPGLRPFAGKILATGEEPENFEFIRNGETILLNVRYIAELDWLLFVEQNETGALHIAKMNFFRTLAIGLISSLIVISLTLATINSYQSRLEEIAVSDELTGVGNRRKLEEEFSKAAYTFSRNHQNCSLILMDLDRFKIVNDQLGHLYGDVILKSVCREITQVIRPTDVLARWGGDEFAILAISSPEDASLMAERIRKAIEEIDWVNILNKKVGAGVDVTVSCGIAMYTEGDTLSDILSRADASLYRAKHRGGNSVDSEA